MRMATRFLALSLVWTASTACDPGDEEMSSSARAIELHPITSMPGCFEPPTDPAPTAGDPGPDSASEAISAGVSAVRQVAEFQASFGRQTVEFLLTPLREHPDRDRWSLTFETDEGRVHKEGAVLARGVAFASIAASSHFEPNDADTPTHSASVEIFHDGRATRYRFHTGEIEVGDRFVKTEHLTRGCTREGARFETYFDARMDLKGKRCWGPDGALVYSHFGSSAIPEAPERASAALACARIEQAALFP